MGANEKESLVMEIDVGELIFALWKKVWVLILSTIMMGALFFLVTKYTITPLYESSSQMLILTKETTLTSLANLQLSNYLTSDYKELLLSAPVLQEVVDKLELDFDYKELKEMITVENPQDTRILIANVQDIDPERACAIANELAKVSSAYIGEIMEMTPPKIIGKSEVNPKPCSPNLMMNTIIGAFLGLAVCAIIIIVMTILDDTIKNEDDIEKYLKTVNLASVPDRKDYITSDVSKKKRRNKKSRKRRGK